jgi:hypothetical protein
MPAKKIARKSVPRAFPVISLSIRLPQSGFYATSLKAARIIFWCNASAN